MALVMLVFWTIVVAAIIALVRASHSGGPQHDAGRTGDAEHILAERFARGEIDADDYKQRRDLLRSS
jgi:putative membrane protein